MDRKQILERVYNVMDLGYFIETVKNSMKVKLEMGMKEFLGHLFLGKGYQSVPPITLEKMMIEKQAIPIIDLREKQAFRKYHIKGAILYPFDDFLKSVLMDGQFKEYHNRPLVLVCDTGHKSRAAAAILAETGFNKVFSLSRGMRRYRRWQYLRKMMKRSKNRQCRICWELAGLGFKGK